jgi:cytochrome c-type biogenesis protein CcmE
MRILILATLIVTETVACAAAGTLSPSDLIRDASKYDGKMVAVTGAVTLFRSDVSIEDHENGNLSATSELCDASNCVHVFWKGASPDFYLSEGRRVTVHGAFSVRKEVGPSRHFCEIDVNGQ